MRETWKPIPGYEGIYEASDLGRVRSLDRVTVASNGVSRKWKGRVLKQNKNGSGYLQVVLSKPGGVNNLFVHRLVFMAFNGEIQSGRDICHCDGDKHNNRSGNLRSDTRAGNMKDAIKHGVSPRGERNSQSKLTAEEVLQMRREFASGECSRSDLAEKYQVNRTQIGLILTGRAWSGVGGPIVPKIQNWGEGAKDGRLKPETVSAIREMHASKNITHKSISDHFKVSTTTVTNIINRRIWKNI